ncbi:UDP-glucose 4-epimerase GalE [bacterium]|nr:UDP-glucose 4-epimerase GalE [bacterium]
MKLLLTGGAGYIGSHTCIELLNLDIDVVVIDNLSNSSYHSLERVQSITDKNITFIEGDVRDKELLRSIFRQGDIDGVIHFAGLKAVGESNEIPLQYYDNNLNSTITLLQIMEEYDCRNFIFSSSATVYGNPEKLPITEDFPLSVTNPYGRTKLMNEDILRDFYKVKNNWNIVLLRYFNPVGAHPSGLIGEDPNGIPNNLLPYITQVAVGKLGKLNIFGDDYDTPDGTGIRDYIHVVDLAKGHAAALQKLKIGSGLNIFNLGTGRGYSVLEMVDTFSKVNNLKIDYQIVSRREGDIASCYADPSKANKELNWKAIYGLEDICRDAWNWQSNNPNGYKKTR